MRKSLFFGLLISISGIALGQDKGPTPAQTLRLARATYEQGRLHEITTQLSDSSFFKRAETTKQEKVEGYKLLCLTYIYLEEPKQADQAMLNLKYADPYFVPNPQVDPAEFVSLYKTFREEPIFRAGVLLGGNFSQPNVKELVAVNELTGDSEYKRSLGLQFGAAIDVPLSFFKTKNKFTLHGELLYQQRKFEIDQKESRGFDPVTGEELFNEFEGIESQGLITLPVSLQYRFLNKEKLNPFFGIGLAPEFMLKRELTAEKTRSGQSSVPEKGEDLEHQSFNLSGIVSVGIKLPLRPGFVVFELRYSHGLTNITTDEDVYANEILALDYGFADSIFKMSSLSLSGSYVFDKFKPKKIGYKK